MLFRLRRHIKGGASHTSCPETRHLTRCHLGT